MNASSANSVLDEHNTMKEIEYEGPALSEEEKKQVHSRGSEKVRPVRTFQEDVEVLMQKGAITQARTIEAEVKRREERGESRVVHHDDTDGPKLGKIILGLGTILMFSLGVGIYALFGAGGSSTNLLTGSTTPSSPTRERLSLEEGSPKILLSNKVREEIFADIIYQFGTIPVSTGEMHEARFIVTNERKDERDATAEEIFKAIVPNGFPPPAFLRSIDAQYLFGVHKGKDLTGIFVLTSRSYPNTFGALYDWESSLAREILPMVNPWYVRKEIQVLEGEPFRDRRLGEVNSRVLLNANNEVVLGYLFLNGNTLIIAGSEDALRFAVTKQLSVSGFGAK
jgi:hypothetical protein